MIQIERFFVFALKRYTFVDFLRIEVYVSIFNNSVGRDINWFQYRVMAMLCYVEEDFDNGHY